MVKVMLMSVLICCLLLKIGFSIDAILEFLKKIKGYDATISDDAGRFVCNYVYYHSLRFAKEKGHKSLFVHVPPFSRINQETQMEFLASLLEAIALSCWYYSSSIPKFNPSLFVIVLFSCKLVSFLKMISIHKRLWLFEHH